ncbi:MAG: hypothetical protein ACRENP_03290 [Longimicrobiales bacterium]
MKLILVTPRAESDVRLRVELKRTERRLRSGPTAFSRVAEGKWKHVRYPGWIKFDEAPGGFLVAQAQTKRAEAEWQILQAFIGYLDRHLGGEIESIAILYR